MSNAEMKFEVKITATGEVRDKDGNLLSQSPMESESRILTAEEIKQEFSLTDDDIREIIEGTRDHG